MRRRSRASSKLAKARSRKARRNAPTVRHRSPAHGQETEIARLTRELKEAREQQTATGDVLKVISRSTFDLQTVLDTLVKSAARLCQADMVSINRPRDGAMYFAANFGLPQEFEEIAKRTLFVPGRGTVVGRVLLAGKPVQIADVKADPEYTFTEGQRVAGFRTSLGVPLEREGETIGVIVLVRTKVQPFTEKQIELVQNFAAQAVIAIENARLLNELRGSLDRQTATADILRVIAGTPEDSKQALNTIAETAVRMFDANSVNFRRIEGDALRIIAAAGPMAPRLREALLDIPLEPADPSVRCFLDNHQTAIEDRRVALASERGKIARLVRDIQVGSQAFTPLSRQGKAIGVMIVARTEVRPFQQSELDLMTGFADQAVIAIENARLLNELRQRTDDLGRSVNELQALGEVSQAVNSTLDLKTVLSTIVSKAVQLSGTEAGTIYEFDEIRQEFKLRATYGMSEGLISALENEHIGLDEPSIAAAIAQREPMQVADLVNQAPTAVNEIILRAGYRALLLAPLLRGQDIVGLLVIRRKAPGVFAKSTMALLQTFADQ